jgi:arylsulfatase A-like enzyme
MKKPNILVIMTDQQRTDTLSCYRPDGICQTPNLDALADDGVVFHNAYTTCAVCSPARASLHTGLFPSKHGMESNVYGNGCVVHELVDCPELLSRRLQSQGYSTGYTGKWHLGNGADTSELAWVNSKYPRNYIENGTVPSDVGFEGDDFPGHGSGGYRYPQFLDYLKDNKLQLTFNDETRHRRSLPCSHTQYAEITSPIESTMEYYLVDRAIDLIRMMKSRTEPFCFMLNFWGPHEPYYAPTQYLDLYRNKPIPAWDNYEDPLIDKPKIHNIFRRDDVGWEFFEEALRYNYGFLTSIDAQIGRLFDFLKALNLYDDMTIIMTADHGDSQGCHAGIENKSVHMYEEIMRIPLLVKDGSRSGGQDVSDFANTCDVYSTILDYAGSGKSEQERDGRSLRPIVENRAAGWKDSEVSEGLGVTSMLCSSRMLRYKHYKYVFYSGGIDELYDLENDPLEIKNLAEMKDFSNLLHEMKVKLAKELKLKNDPLWGPYCKVSGIGYVD